MALMLLKDPTILQLGLREDRIYKLQNAIFYREAALLLMCFTSSTKINHFNSLSLSVLIMTWESWSKTDIL